MTSMGQTDNVFDNLMSEQATKDLIGRHLSLGRIVKNAPPDLTYCLTNVITSEAGGHNAGTFDFTMRCESKLEAGIV